MKIYENCDSNISDVSDDISHQSNFNKNRNISCFCFSAQSINNCADDKSIYSI